VMRWCKAVGLPIKLRDLGDLDTNRLAEAAEKACDSNDSMASMPFVVTPRMVLESIREVDRLAKELD